MTEAREFDSERARRDLERLLLDTNDQRRRVGQAFYHFYRTLVFWQRRGYEFERITRLWASCAADHFDAVARAPEAGEASRRDEDLRGYAAGLLERLAADLDRGSRSLPLFLSWLETRFPALTDLMRASDPADRVSDAELATLLSVAFGRAAQAADGAVAEPLREAARALSGASAPPRAPR